MRNGEYVVEWEDGTYWLVAWEPDIAAFWAHHGEDEDSGLPPDRPRVACPGASDGVYLDLRAVEVSMGRPLPADVRAALEADERRWPAKPDAVDDSRWIEVTMATPDGRLVDIRQWEEDEGGCCWSGA